MSEDDNLLKVPIIGAPQPERASKYYQYTTKTIPDADFHMPQGIFEDAKEDSVLTSFIKLSLPANIKLAEIHGKCKLLYNLKDIEKKPIDPDNTCPCCGFRVGEKFTITDDPDNFAQLGASYPLFFYTGRFLARSLFIVFLVAGIACSVTFASSSSPYILIDRNDGKMHESNRIDGNIEFDKLHQTIENYQNILLNNTEDNNKESFCSDKKEGNLGIIDSSDDIFSFSSKNNPSVPMWHPILHSVCCIMLMIVFVYFYCYIYTKAGQYDKELITCSDFSLFFVGLPNSYKKIELRNFIMKCLEDKNKNKKVEIVNITSGYKFGEFNETSQKLAKWLFNLNFVKKYKEKHEGVPPTKGRYCWKKNYKDEDQCYEKAEKYRQQLKDKSKEIKTSNMSSCAFVSFRRTEQEKDAENLWRLSLIRRNIYIAFRCCKLAPNHFYFNGKKENFLLVRRAPEPKDIYWENLGKFTWKKITSKGSAFFFSLVILGVSFMIIIFCTAIQNNSSGSGFTIENFLLSNVVSMTITFANKIAPIGFRYCSKFEKYLTWSFFGVSMLIKILIFHICNSIILPAIVHKSMKFDEFATSIYSVIYSTTVISPIIDYINVLGRLKKLRKRRLKEHEILSLTQLELNEIYEGDEVELSESFASIIKSFALCLFFAPIVPMGLLIGSLGMFLELYIFKLGLIRDKTRPRFDSEVLAIAALLTIPWCFILYASGILLFYSSLYEDLYDLYVAVLLISIGFAFVCYTGIIHRAFNLLDKNKMEKDYFEHYESFTTDYERENPVTEKQGHLKRENFQNTEEGINKFCEITEDVIGKIDIVGNRLPNLGNNNYKNQNQNINDAAAYMTRRDSNPPQLVIN